MRDTTRAKGARRAYLHEVERTPAFGPLGSSMSFFWKVAGIIHARRNVDGQILTEEAALELHPPRLVDLSAGSNYGLRC